MRKLASIQKIIDIQPIDGADFIEIITVNGWDVVSKKGVHSVGDLIVYFEIDSFLPVRDEFEFLRSSCFKSTKNLGDGFRVKTIKLRKQLSQGLILPLAELFDDESISTLKEDDDVTEALGVQKYETAIPAQLAGVARGNFPSFINKTDQTRVQSFVRKHRYDEKEGRSVPLVSGDYEVSLKLDGSSMTVYFNDGNTGVCSRNIDLTLDEDNSSNTFVNVAQKEYLLDKVEMISKAVGYNVALQGELMGEGVQGNREGLVGTSFYLFDIYNISQQCYVSPKKRREIARQFDLKEAPIIYDSFKISSMKNPTDILSELLKEADRESINHKIAEGLVFKSNSDLLSFKVINNKYLLKCEV